MDQLSEMLSLRELFAAEEEELEFIANLDLFAGLTADEHEELKCRLIRHAFPTGSVLISQGDPGSSLFLIQQGKLDISIAQADGRSAVVAQVRAGGFVGEMSLLTGAPRAATVIAAENCVVYELRKEDLAPLMHRRRDLLYCLAQTLAERQRANARRMGKTEAEMAPLHVATQQFYGRIGDYFEVAYAQMN